MSIGKVCDVSPKVGLVAKTFIESFLASLGKVAEKCFQSTIIPSLRVMLAQEILLEISLMVA